MTPDPQLGLFAEEDPEATEATADPNPMVRAHGPGPADRECKDCAYLYAKRFANRYYKCLRRGDSGGPGTDHRVHWNPCALFAPAAEPPKSGGPLSTAEWQELKARLQRRTRTHTKGDFPDAP